jgi:hypothetical protein
MTTAGPSRWRGVGDVVAVAAITGLAVFTLDQLVQPRLPRAAQLGAMAVLHLAAALGALWAVLLRSGRYAAAALGLVWTRQTAAQGLLGLVYGAALAAGAVGLAVAAGALVLRPADVAAHPGPGVLLGVVATLAVSALFEELAFRSGITAPLAVALPRWLALGGPSVAFALGHLLNPHLSVLAMLNTALAGLWLSLLFLDRANRPTAPALGAVTGAHAGWNLALYLLGVPISGFQLPGRFVVALSTQELWSGGAYGVEGGLAATVALGVAVAGLARRLDAQVSGR